MVFQTRSGPKVVDKDQTNKGSLCHHGRHYPLKSTTGGLWCSKCRNFYCKPCLENYDVNTRNGPASLWVCYVCQGTCRCDRCQKPTLPRRNPKKKEKEKEKEEEEQAKKKQSVDKQQQLCKVSEALAALASASSVSRERKEFLKLVNEINLYHSMMDKEGTDGEQDIRKAYKAAHEEIDDSTDEHVPDGASSALINRVDAMLQKLEKDIDDMDAKIGDEWRVLDRDYDGKVTSASATAYLKDAMAKDKATSEEENQKPEGESSSCVLDDEEEHSPLVFEAAESFYGVLDDEQEREQVDEDEEHVDEEDEVLKVLYDATASEKRSSLSPLSPLNLETSLKFIAEKMDQISMTMSRRLAFARLRKMRVLVTMSMTALPQLSAKGISYLAWALSKIGGELLYLPEMDRVAEVGLTKVADFDSEDIATVALAFASMKHSAPRLFTELSKRASDIVSTFQPQELTELLWAFAYLYEATAAEELLACLDQFTFNDNECLQRDWLVLEFNYSQLRNVCWSYAVLGQMNRTFFFHIWKILRHFQEQISEDKKILLVHQCLKFEYPYLSSLNKYIDETCIPAEITRSDEYMSSSFHKKVRRFLAKTVLDSTKEYFVDGYTLDPSLVDLKVVLAIVGPNHFSRNLRNALGYTVLLHRHYEATGWKVVTVSHEKWQGLKGTDKQRDYLREIIHGQGG